MNAKELFNLRHSQLRNEVEKTFKKRFRILREMPSYQYPFQIQLVTCCMVLHNFIRHHQRNDDIYDNLQDYDSDDDDNDSDDDDNNVANQIRNNQVNNWRDDIANRMWVPSTDYFERHGRRR